MRFRLTFLLICFFALNSEAQLADSTVFINYDDTITIYTYKSKHDVITEEGYNLFYTTDQTSPLPIAMDSTSLHFGITVVPFDDAGLEQLLSIDSVGVKLFMEEVLQGEILTGSGTIEIDNVSTNYYRFTGTLAEKPPFLNPNREIFCLVRKTENNNILMVGDYLVSEMDEQIQHLKKILINIKIN